MRVSSPVDSKKSFVTGGHRPNPDLPSPKPVVTESMQSSLKRRIGLQVFVATNQSQGMFPDDFNLAVEGEFVVPPSDIGPDNKKVMVGIVTAKSTTTFKVVPLDIPRAHFVHLIAEFYLRAGWVNFPQKAQEMAKETVADIFATARHYRIGDIVGKSEGTTYYQRG